MFFVIGVQFRNRTALVNKHRVHGWAANASTVGRMSAALDLVTAPAVPTLAALRT